MAVVALFVFFLLRFAPGDPAAIIAGEDATNEAIEAADAAWRRPNWRDIKPHERAGILHRIAALIRERSDARYARASRIVAVASVAAALGLAWWWGLPSGLLLVLPYVYFLARSLALRPDAIPRVRRFDRVDAGAGNYTHFTRSTGEQIRCEVIDLSLTSVSVRTDLKPPVGEHILIGHPAGRIVGREAAEQFVEPGVIVTPGVRPVVHNVSTGPGASPPGLPPRARRRDSGPPAAAGRDSAAIGPSRRGNGQCAPRPRR
mgnify:CR=1 FL=1